MYPKMRNHRVRSIAIATAAMLLAAPAGGEGLALDTHHMPNGQGQIRRVAVDCIANGVGDDIDVATGASPDLNENGSPDECDPTGDVDGDGIVGFQDLLRILSAGGACAAPCPEDVDGDGAVGFRDLLGVLSNWS